MSSLWMAHLGCAFLLGVDLLARTERLRLLATGTGYRMRRLDALRCNLLADAGAALTPMRLGGEPARLAGMRLVGVQLAPTLATIGWELATAWPTLFMAGTIVTVLCAPTWWQESAPLLSQLGSEAVPALALVAILGIIAAILGHRMRRAMHVKPVATPRPLRAAWRQMPPSTALASIPLSAANIVARTAMLPVLAWTLPDPPTAAAAWFGSFLLVYGQLLFPTPAGIGAVELGFLGGAAGELGSDVGLLLAWRWWSNILPAILGLTVAWGFRAQLRRSRQQNA